MLEFKKKILKTPKNKFSNKNKNKAFPYKHLAKMKNKLFLNKKVTFSNTERFDHDAYICTFVSFVCLDVA